MKWLYLLGKPREYKHHFNEFDETNINSQNIDIIFIYNYKKVSIPFNIAGTITRMCKILEIL